MKMKVKSGLTGILLITAANTLLYALFEQAKGRSLLLCILLFAVISLLVNGVLFFFTNLKLYQMIEEIRNGLLQFNSGNFTSRIQVKTRQKELRAIMEEFEKLKVMMNTWIYELLNSSVSIKNSSGKISASSNHTSKGMENLNRSLGEIEQVFETTLGMLNDVAAASTQLANSSDSIAKSSSSAVEKTREANVVAMDGGDSMNQVSLSMGQIQEDVISAAQIIEGLEGATKEIEGITGTITAISKHTTMLALNAAIESARAGEQGKGFAVVAEEVRKLSDETGNAALQIHQLIESIKGEVCRAVEAMQLVSRNVENGVKVTDQAKANLDGIMKRMEHTVSLIEGISNDVSDQSTGTGLISQNTQSVAAQGKKGTESVQKITEDVSFYMQDADKNEVSARQLLQISNNLETIMDHFDVTLGKQMLRACRYIASLHDKNNLVSEDLMRLREKFGLTEIHLIDENGVVTQTTEQSCFGFQFLMEEGTQTAEFTRILRDAAVQVNQKAAFRDIDGKLFKYAGIATLDKKGIIQVGLDASKISEFVSDFS